MNVEELEQFLKLENEENVMLEYVSKFDEYLNFASRQFYPQKNDFNLEEFAVKEESVEEHLILQLSEISESDEIKQIIRCLIYNLDDKGYLSIEIKKAAELLGVSESDVLKAQEILMRFDPKGIGASNLMQCLLIQAPDELKAIIENHLEDIANNKIKRVATEQNISIEEVYEKIAAIKKLNPYPMNNYSAVKSVNYVIPDIFVEEDKNELKVLGNVTNNIQISGEYLKMLGYDIDAETREYLKNRLARTHFLQQAVNKRNQTIQDIAEFIVDYQKDYFLYKQPLKPLREREVAEALGISVSTVSRAVNTKFIQSKYGVIALKKMFVGSNRKNTVSTDSIKLRIKEIINSENKLKPLSDEKIKTILNEDNIEIKRRTVQKYREELKILPSSKRRIYEEKKKI